MKFRVVNWWLLTLDANIDWQLNKMFCCVWYIIDYSLTYQGTSYSYIHLCTEQKYKLHYHIFTSALPSVPYYSLMGKSSAATLTSLHTNCHEEFNITSRRMSSNPPTWYMEIDDFTSWKLLHFEKLMIHLQKLNANYKHSLPFRKTIYHKYNLLKPFYIEAVA